MVKAEYNSAKVSGGVIAVYGAGVGNVQVDRLGMVHTL